MKELKSLDPVSVAKVHGLIMVIVGLVFGLIAAAASTTVPMGINNIGAASIVIFPIMYGIIGFIGGLIFTWLYNLVAGWIGGIRIELK
ncbi:MAG: hypothetical protein ACQEP1_02710 [Nanobdellota archaeon]